MPIKMVVGLGNPGKKYEKTRHNIGYRVLDLLEKSGLPNVLLYRPSVSMNLVGGPVAEVARKKGYQAQDLLVVCDDFSIPLPKLRLRMKGSSGGHNGLNSVLESLQTLAVPRLRLGIGPVPDPRDPADFVLEPFRKAETITVEAMTLRAAEAVKAIAQHGMEFAMNHYNTEPA